MGRSDRINRTGKPVDQRVNSNFYPIDRSHFIRRIDIKLCVFNAMIIPRISVSFNANAIEKSIN